MAVATGVAPLAGCSTMIDLAGVPHSGSQGDRSYVPTAEEQALDCRQLTVLVNDAVKRTKELAGPVPNELKRGPSSLTALFGQISKSESRGMSSVDTYLRSRKRAEALSGLMRTKGCQPVDIDPDLKEADLIVEAAKASR